MNRYSRQGWIGLAAGFASSPALIATQDSALIAIALAAIIGKGFELLFRYTRYAYLDSLMTGATFGVSFWASISLIIVPVIRGQMPQWTAEGMRALSPQLTGWVLYGASVGLVLQALRDLMRPGDQSPSVVPTGILPNKHVVILGGGFGGKIGWSNTPLCAAAAKAVNRPVKLVLSREATFRMVGGRTISEQHVALGAGKDGKLTSLIHTGLTATIPSGRYATVDEIANMVLFLCSDLASNTTGGQFVVDGGRTATGGAVTNLGVR